MFQAHTETIQILPLRRHLIKAPSVNGEAKLMLKIEINAFQRSKKIGSKVDSKVSLRELLLSTCQTRIWKGMFSLEMAQIRWSRIRLLAILRIILKTIWSQTSHFRDKMLLVKPICVQNQSKFLLWFPKIKKISGQQRLLKPAKETQLTNLSQNWVDWSRIEPIWSRECAFLTCGSKLIKLSLQVSLIC